VPALIRALTDPDGEVAGAARAGLLSLGRKADPTLVDLVSRTDLSSLTRGLASDLLVDAGSAPLPWLLDALDRNEEPADQLYASFSGAGPEAVPPLTSILLNGADSRKIRACRAVSHLGDDGVEARPTLLSLLSSQEEGVRLHALLALGATGIVAGSERKAVLRLRKDPVPEIRHEALTLMVPAFVEKMDDVRPNVRRRVAHLLTRLGDESIPLLVPALRNKEEWVRTMAIELLAQGGTAVVEPLLEELREPDHPHSDDVTTCLARLGEDAVPLLAKALGDPYPDVRPEAAIALGKMAERARSAIPALLVSLGDDSPRLRIWSAYALARTGAPAREYLPIIEAVVASDPDPPPSVLLAVTTLRDLVSAENP
jgi:HEAT repeat protein